MVEIFLPEWLSISAEVSEGTPLNPLERFIFENEPAGGYDVKWRNQLMGALTWVKDNG